MLYPYPNDFPDAARAKVAAINIRAARDLEAAKSNVRGAPELEAILLTYILRVFLSFAEEALELGRRGIWSVDVVETQSREFLRVTTLEAWSEKGLDRKGHHLRAVTGHWDGAIIPEVQREFEKSPVWKRFMDGLLEVAELQARASLIDSGASQGVIDGPQDAGLPHVNLSLDSSGRPSHSSGAAESETKSQLDIARIGEWMSDAGYTNESLGLRLHASSRAVASLRSNGRYHGRSIVQKLANLMGCDMSDLYLP